MSMYRYMLIEPVETMLGRLKQPYSSNAPPHTGLDPKNAIFPRREAWDLSDPNGIRSQLA